MGVDCSRGRGAAFHPRITGESSVVKPDPSRVGELQEGEKHIN